MTPTRTPAVIIVWHHSITGRPEINGAPVWGWSKCDRGRGLDAPQTICGDAVDGDYIVHHDTYRENGDTPRARPWEVVRAWARHPGGRVEVGIGTRAISHHRRIEDAIATAAAMLRRDERERAAEAATT